MRGGTFRHRDGSSSKHTIALLSLFVSLLPAAMAQSCVSLSGSTLCPAWNTASVYTGLNNLFPFLVNVTSTSTFDSAFKQYITQGYAQEKYGILFGCSNANLQNTTNLYARYTTSFLCNAIIQNSITPCSLSAAESVPLCASACSYFAISEEAIISNPSLCGTYNSNALKQLRADLTNCELPSKAISTGCVSGAANEPDNCGYSTNLGALCSLCRASTVNATDSCCVTSETPTRCKNVDLPVFSSLQPLFSSTSQPTGTSQSSATPSNSPSSSNGSSGLSGGAIAGIVIGSIVALILLLVLLYYCCFHLRRNRILDEKNALNQPSPPRSGKQTSQNVNTPRFEVMPGARVTRMAALEDESSEGGVSGLPAYQPSSSEMDSSPNSDMAPGVMGGAMAAAAYERRKKSNSESLNTSSGYSTSNGDQTPDDRLGRQSEQMPFFKDYYSDDDIHPGDHVSTLWAYQPQAPDEFELERGDMLRIVGIWDDGWATGVRISDRAEDWESERNSHRDSGVSNGSKTDDSPPTNGDLKAFPLVCVCLPQHWKKTLEGDQSQTGHDLE